MIDPQDLKQIRLYADGELNPADAAEFERRMLADPDFRRVVDGQLEVERAIKSTLAGVLGSATAPQALKARVQQSMAAGSQRPVLARLFAGPQHASVLAVAATLALVTGVILFSIFGRTIDEVGMSSEAALVSSAAISFDQEHRRCAGELDDKFLYLAPDDAERELSKLFAVGVRIPDLQAAGYEFCGAAAPCSIQILDKVALAHLLYRKRLAADAPANARRPMVSVFIIPNTATCSDLAKGLLPMKWEPVKVEECRATILRASDCKLIYFMVCCSERDAPALVQLATSQAPAP